MHVSVHVRVCVHKSLDPRVQSAGQVVGLLAPPPGGQVWIEALPAPPGARPQGGWEPLTGWFRIWANSDWLRAAASDAAST